MDNSKKDGFKFKLTSNGEVKTYAEISQFLFEQSDKIRKHHFLQIREWLDNEISKIDNND